MLIQQRTAFVFRDRAELKGHPLVKIIDIFIWVLLAFY